jgi:murein DD-endopeptidase MepM/ murein hydrolase activator NlpD
MMESRYHTRTLLRIGGSLVLAALIAGCNASGAPEGAKITTSGAGGTYNQPTNMGSTGYSATAPNGYAAPYTVVPGDTVYGVAQRMNVPVRSLIDANGLKPPYRLAPGQQLAMPGGGTYDPDLAVTAPAPAATYGSGGTGGDTDGTYAGSASGSAPRVITSTGSIAMEDLSPAAGGSNATAQPPASATVPATASPSPTIDATESDLPLTPTVKPAAPSTATTAPVPSASTMPPQNEVATIPDATTTDGQFQWPLQGKVISRFGAKIGGQHNDGINIAAHAGDKVLAADGGVVAYSGNELKGFGNLLLIRHANGWITAYAHNQKLLVNKGDKVKRGQPIATVGATGNVESPQLHFEIRRGSDPVDPLQHLASRG